MFDDNHTDKHLKAILDSGKEDVPSHIWDGISEGLERAERRKTVMIWFRRAGAVAVAAAVALGVILHGEDNGYEVPVPTDSEMIAVVEPEITEQETGIVHQSENLVAHSIQVTSPVHTVQATQAVQTIQTAHIEVKEDTHQTPGQIMAVPEQESRKEPRKESAPVEWEEDDTELNDRTPKVSIVISGITGTNNPQDKSGSMPLKSPSIGKQYTKTTIEQADSEAIYGIPVSFGIGTRIHLTDRWSIGAGISYTLLTSRYYGKYIKVTDGIAEEPISGNVRNRQHYLGIPINAYYNFIQKDFINFYAYAGGAVEKCIMDKYQMQAGTVINHSERARNVQLSANAGIGVEFMLGKHVGIYIDPSLRYYFYNGQSKNIRTAQPLMFGFETGLRFNL